jgi:hypothetical protein
MYGVAAAMVGFGISVSLDERGLAENGSARIDKRFQIVKLGEENAVLLAPEH